MLGVLLAPDAAARIHQAQRKTTLQPGSVVLVLYVQVPVWRVKVAASCFHR